MEQEMSDIKKSAKQYFDYLKQAKKVLEIILEVHPELVDLTSKEMEVFEKLLTEKTVAKIAEELFLSTSSVHFHCKNIYKKINVSNRKQILINYKDLI